MLPLSDIRILLLADTHLGFDLPFKPRVERRRRGEDFFANFDRALEPAFRGEVDLVVHGGDLLYRSRVPAALVEAAMAPLVQVARQGVPVFLVPGNHERSRVPLHLWARHNNLHIFDEPKTFLCPVAGGAVALSGFPFVREVRDRFRALVDQTGYREVEADVRVLCIHQTVEGARVGPSGYTFRAGTDVVCGRDIAPTFAAVLAGHIHRAQVLTHDLGGRRLGAPVFYPGSIERTAFAERNEPKGCMDVRVGPAGAGKGRRVGAEFVPLPARPMVVVRLEPGDEAPEVLLQQVRASLSALEPDAVVRIELHGNHAEEAQRWLSAPLLREIAPRGMNVELLYPRRGAGGGAGGFA